MIEFLTSPIGTGLFVALECLVIWLYCRSVKIEKSDGSLSLDISLSFFEGAIWLVTFVFFMLDLVYLTA